MAIDFEEEARIVETVTRPGDRKRGKLMPVLLASGALAVLAYAGYVSFIKPDSAKKTEANEEFKTASRAAQLNFDPENPPPLPSDNKLVLVPPATTPATVEQPQVVAPVVAPAVVPPAIDEEAARRAAEEAERAKKEEELRQARLHSNMLVVDQPPRGEGAGAALGASSTQAAGSGVSGDDDPNRRFVQSVGSEDVETVNRIPQRSDRCPDPAGNIDPRRSGDGNPVRSSRHGKGRHLDRRLLLRRPADPAAEGNDADRRI